MRLYHYTSIETLALILKYKQILFNRLDNGVDDIEETCLSSSAFAISNRFFVSCWTKNPNENLALWKLYTKNGTGVRIGLSDNMFDNNPPSPNQFCVQIPKIYDEWTCSFLYKVFGNRKSNLRLYQVTYVDNVIDYIKKGIRDYDNRHRFLDLEILSATKNKIWEFQDEMRFVINGMPFSKYDEINKKKAIDKTGEMVDVNGKSLKFICIDLTQQAFNDISITLGPCCSEAHRLLVEAIVEKANLPLDIIKESIMHGKVGFK